MSCLLAKRKLENIRCALICPSGAASNSRSRARLAALSLESADSLFVPLLSHCNYQLLMFKIEVAEVGILVDEDRC